jgi:hypothetical protein
MSAQSLDQVDLLSVYAALGGKPSARRHRGGQEILVRCPNPAHRDSQASCSIHLEKSVFRCFGCSAKGGVLAFTMLGTGLRDERAAIEWLESRGFLAPSRNGHAVNRMPAEASPPRPSPLVDKEKESAPDRGRRIHMRTLTHDYVDLEGVLRYRITRNEWTWEKTGERGKELRAARPDGRGGWVFSLAGIERIPYRLRELRAACKRGEPVCVVEGEKKADLLAQRVGLAATTNAFGANGEFPAQWAAHFAGTSFVIVLADSDEPGRACAQRRADLFADAAVPAIVVDLFPARADGVDIIDWLQARAGKSSIALLQELDPLICRSIASATREAGPGLASPTDTCMNRSLF